MSEQLALEWGLDSVRLIRLKIDGHRITVQQSGRHEWSQPESARTETEAANELRKWLDELGIGRESVTVVLPRDSIVLRRLDLPSAPDEELPDLVRFQAATKSSSPIDELVLDFLPLPQLPDYPGRTAIAFSVDRQRLTRIDSILRAAGLTPLRATLSATAISRLVQWALPRTQSLRSPALIVHQQSSRVEIAALESGNLIFSHSTRLPEGDSSRHVQPLKAEINRSLVALSQVHDSAQIEHCYLLSAGSPDSAVVFFLEEFFPGQLSVVGEDSLPPEAAGFEALVGSLVPADRHVHDIDFLHPRKKVEKPDRRKLYWSVAGSVAALVLLSGYLMFRSQVAGYESRIEDLTQEQVKLQDQLKLGAPRLDYHGDISDWTTSQADLRRLWTQFASKLPGTDQLYLTDLNVIPQADDEFVAKVEGTVHARRREDVNNLSQRLVDDGYRVTPSAPTETGDDPDYPFRYSLKVDIPRPVQQPTATAKMTSSPPKSAG